MMTLTVLAVLAGLRLGTTQGLRITTWCGQSWEVWEHGNIGSVEWADLEAKR